MSASGERARFLFRNEDGTIDAATWRRHAAWLFALVVVMTGLWFVLRPYAHHDLATSAFIAPLTILAFAYLIVYAFVVLVVAVSFTMLSVKRLRDVGDPTSLAGLVPFLALLDGSLHFLQAKTPDAISYGYVVALDVVFAAALIWTIWRLGVQRG